MQKYPRGYGVSFSPDGIHWRDYEENPVVWGGDVNRVFYDEASDRYVAYLRCDYPYIRGFPRRSISFTMSKDFINWRNPGLVLVADEIDDTMVEEKVEEVRQILSFDDPLQWRAELYGMAVFPYEGLYLGHLWVFYTSGTQGGRDIWPPRPGMDGPIDTQLTLSRNLLDWKRLGNRKPIIPRGKPGDWDGGMIQAYGNPLIVGDEIWIYYRGHSRTHGGQSWRSAMGLAKLRLDGFVSIDAGETEGTLTTKPFVFKGERLIVNANANRGSLLVELLGDDEKPISGFSQQECNVFHGDSVCHNVTWSGNREVASLQGNAVRLRFHLASAKLFSFMFEGHPAFSQ